MLGFLILKLCVFNGQMCWNSMNMWNWASDIGSPYPIFCWGRSLSDDHPAEDDGDDSKDGEDGKDGEDHKEEGAGSYADSDNDHDW